MMMLTVPCGICRGVRGRRISIAEGSAGAGKSPQGFTEVAVAKGVAVAVGGGGGVIVGAIGPKGVAVAVAAGSTVAMIIPAPGAPDINMPAILVQAPTMKTRMINVAKVSRRSENIGYSLNLYL